jgi:hypothetical protein
MKIPKYTFFWIMVATSLLYLFFSIVASILTWTDEKYMASLPTDGDSMGIPIFGLIFGNIILTGICAVYYAILWNQLETKQSLSVVSISEFLSIKTNKIVVVIKYALMGLLAFIICTSFINYEFISPIVFVFEMLCFVCFIVSVLGNLSLWNAISRSTKRKYV